MVWYVALGSALGGASRFLLSSLIQGRMGADFPYGTLIVNITGSFLLGFLLRYALATTAISPEARAFLTTGFCGGYTTFSTFSYEAATLLEGGQALRAMWYVGGSVIISLAGTVAGSGLAAQLLALKE